MKKLFYLTAVATLALACSEKEKDNNTTTAPVAVTSVTLNKTTAALVVGDTLTLMPTVKPDDATNKSVTWTSSDIAVATVANGTITAVAVGVSTIIAATEDGGKTAICALTVRATPTPVTGVTLSQTTAELTVGDTLRLTATVEPDSATIKSVAWESSNTAVATVANGKITAVAVGTADITVTTDDGNKTATCAVTVNPIAVTSVTLSQTVATLAIGETLTLTATIAPDNAANKNVAWASSNPAVATVSNNYGSGLVTAVAVGTANITVTTEDGSKTATCAVTINSWHTSVFGTATFATDSTWTVGSQTWSDAVQTSVCSNKTTYDSNNTNGDCRSNPNYKGDLFNWYAVENNKRGLCPAGWRVPTRQEFIDLDIVLGGTGEEVQWNNNTPDAYCNTWGGVIGGRCDSVGTHEDFDAYYWSQSQQSEFPDLANSLLISMRNGLVLPYFRQEKYYGLSLRCVRND